MNLTAKVVAALQLPAGKADVIYFDAALPGFGYRLRRGANGKVLRSFVVQYRRAGGTRRIMLGNAAVLSAAAAREQARKVLGRVANGEDPQADKIDRRAKDQLTLRGVIDEHLGAKAKDVRPRTLVELTRYLTGTYFKPLHGMPVDAVTRKDIAARLVVTTRESGSITAARARAAINGLFVWAMQMGFVESNPVIGTIQPKDSDGRSRVLTGAELAAVWRAAGDDEYGKIVRLLILTGCRRQEVGGMQWGELDQERGEWTIPAERAKNKRAHTLPLPPAAWRIVGSVRRMANRDYLFGLRAEGFRAWADGKAELDKALGDGVRPFVLHDIRRTVATMMAEGDEEGEQDRDGDERHGNRRGDADGPRLGIQPHVIEALLNHESGHKAGVAGVYNRAKYRREVRAALALWADTVRALVDGGERKIVPLPAAG